MGNPPRTPVPLLLGFHCHQPVGNFASVFRRACAECYGPLLERMGSHPAFAFSLHLSGILLEWMEKNERGIFDLVRTLSQRGQAELLGSGYCEPVLCVLPRRDALGQLAMMSRYIADIAGRPPRGVWLTERVWDPSLPALLREAGLEYAMVDDNHLRSSDLPAGRLGGYVNVEAAGERVSLFPISQRLRYLIPFHPVREVMDEFAALPAQQAAVIFDDGEKFGLWPGTREWVHGKGWLESFLAAVEGSGTVRPLTYSAFLDAHPPLGRAVVPPASYREMEEWSLPPREGGSYRELWEHLRTEGREEQARLFLHGGTWPGFLLRYPESDLLYRRMLRISSRLAGCGRDLPAARLALYRGQCNDAYWHGVFGGLYLPVLRDGVSRELSAAERELDRALGLPAPELADRDGDGEPEATVHGGEAVFTVSAARGGQITVLCDKDSLHDLCGALARRPELYHRPAAAAPAPGVNGRALTIHEAPVALPPGMGAHLAYDWYPRHSFIDHLLPPDAALAHFARCECPEWGDFVDQPYRLELKGDRVSASRRGGAYRRGREMIPFEVEKAYTLRGRAITAAYRVANRGRERLDALFAVELNLHLPSGEGARASADGRAFALDEPAAGKGNALLLTDEALPHALTLSLPGAAGWWSFAVRTVSRSEEGFDLTTQGISLTFLLPRSFAPGRDESFTLELSF
jgi:hypothetical protein